MRAPLVLALVAVTLPLLSCVAGRILTKSVTSLGKTPEPAPVHVAEPVRKDAGLAVLWIGHATVLVQLDDAFVLTDPVFTDTVGEISKRLVLPGLSPDELPPLDVAVVSHMHFDHLSYGSLDRIEDRVPQLLVPRGGLVYVPNYRFEATEVSTWRSWRSPRKPDLTVTSVPVQHVGFRYGVDAAWMKTSFTGWVIQYHGMTVYYGGDTAYDAAAFRATAARFPRIDVALLPIAPIHPREFMRHTHMDPHEAVQAFLDLGARVMVPVHFDTFVNSGDEPGEAPRALEQARVAHGLGPDRVQILRIGEQRVLLPRGARENAATSP